MRKFTVVYTNQPGLNRTRRAEASVMKRVRPPQGVTFIALDATPIGDAP